MRSFTRFTGLAVSCVLAVASICACTSSSSPSATHASSSSHAASSPAAGTASSPSSAPTGKDQSSKVLGYHLAADAATTTSVGSSFGRSVTLHIVKFAAGDDSTLLTFYLTAEKRTAVTGFFLDWSVMPSFTDPGSKTVYKVNTYKRNSAPRSDKDGNYECVCSMITAAGGPSDKVVYTAQYPALPSGTSTVRLTDPHFKAVNVPVSREGATR